MKCFRLELGKYQKQLIDCKEELKKFVELNKDKQKLIVSYGESIKYQQVKVGRLCQMTNCC